MERFVHKLFSLDKRSQTPLFTNHPEWYQYLPSLVIMIVGYSISNLVYPGWTTQTVNDVAYFSFVYFCCLRLTRAAVEEHNGGLLAVLWVAILCVGLTSSETNPAQLAANSANVIASTILLALTTVLSILSDLVAIPWRLYV